MSDDLNNLLPGIAPSPQKPFYPKYKTEIPKIHCFSLSDFHDFERCSFRFFVKHHLGKKYELEEGSPNMTIGSLLDLAIKKLHSSRAYDQPVSYLINLVKAAEVEMKNNVARRGQLSFYGSQIGFLDDQVIKQAQEIFKSYLQRIKKVKGALSKDRFWEYVIKSPRPLKLWGGPDAIEMGIDGVPEIVDYKYFGDQEKGKSNLDMDLMPKLYTLLCAQELAALGYSQFRFKIRFWQNPEDESYFEEFDLTGMKNIEDYFKDKIERILRTTEVYFCNKDYCKVCSSSERDVWLNELQAKSWMRD